MANAFKTSDATISVELVVSKYRVHKEDDRQENVEVWGHVGDYEVSVFLPVKEAILKGVFGPVPLPKKKPNR